MRSRHLGLILVSKSVDQITRLLALSDLRKCLDVADEIGALEVVEGADPHLEMGALYELSLQKPVPPVRPCSTLWFRLVTAAPVSMAVFAPPASLMVTWTV